MARRRRKARSNPRRHRARTAGGRFRKNPRRRRRVRAAAPAHRRRRRRVSRVHKNPGRRRYRRNPEVGAGTGAGWAGAMNTEQFGPRPPKSRRVRRTKGGRTLMRAKRKPGPKKGYKRPKVRRRTKTVAGLAALTKTSKGLSRRIRKTKGKSKRSRNLRYVMRARRMGINVRRRYQGLTGEAQKMAKAHGLMRVNPSLGALGKDLLTMLPSIGAFAGTAIAAMLITSKIQTKLEEMQAKEADATKRMAFVTSGQSAVLVSATVTVAAYAAARAIRPLNKFAGAILFGGAAATLVQALQKVQVDNNDAATKTASPKISLGKRLGLPIGDYVGVGGFVTVDGRRVGVNGLGDYVGVGDYVPMGSIFKGSSLGRLNSLGDAQDPLGRDGDHGIRNEESVLDFEQMDGALSGSIFD